VLYSSLRVKIDNKYGKGAFKVKNNNLFVTIHILIPVITMFVLAYTSFAIEDDLLATGLILNSLMIYFPVIFLVQGIVCALLRANVFMSLGISTLAFIVVLIVWLNSSAIIYIFVYLVIGFIGYVVTRWIQGRLSPKI